MSLLRLSRKDLARLTKSGNVTVTTTKKGARKTRSGKSQTVSSGSKLPAQGRLERKAYEGQEIVVKFEFAPHPKKRARTVVDTKVLASAFAMARGDMGRFMAAISPKSKGGERDGHLMVTYTPEDTARFEQAVKLTVQSVMAQAGLAPFTCPIETLVDFVFEGDPETWPTSSSDGDLDNLKKAVFDGMNRVGYQDDRLLVRMQSIKRCGPRCGITVRMRPARPEELPGDLEFV